MTGARHQRDQIGLKEANLREDEPPQSSDAKTHYGHSDKRVGNAVVILQEVDVPEELGYEIEIGRQRRGRCNCEPRQRRVRLRQKVREHNSPGDV